MNLRILVTGSSGQLGKEIIKRFADDPDVDLFGYDKDHLDVANIEQVRKAFIECKPDVVINCAALTNVDACEKFPVDAYQVNTVGPGNLAMLCEQFEAVLVHISTDYVFGDSIYSELGLAVTESDITKPMNVYGRTKLAGEQLVSKLCSKHYILRTSWLYGDGHNFVETMLKAAESVSSVQIVDDQYGSPTSTAQLAEVIQTLIPTDKFGLYHVSGEGKASWAEFAEAIFKYARKWTKVEHITTEEYLKHHPNAALRPRCSLLSNARLYSAFKISVGDWHDELKKFLQKGQ